MSPRRITPFPRRILCIVLVVPSVVFPMSQVLLSLMPRNDFAQKSASTRFFFVRNGNKCGKSITFAGKVGHCVKAGPQTLCESRPAENRRKLATWICKQELNFDPLEVFRPHVCFSKWLVNNECHDYDLCKTDAIPLWDKGLVKRHKVGEY